MKKIPVTAFSSSPKIELILNRLQRETGQNRSEIIRNIIKNAGDLVRPTSVQDTSLPNHSPEFLIKNFFELISAGDILLLPQAIISRGDRVLIILPKKTGHLFKYSTWEFPNVTSKSFDFSTQLSAKIKKELNIKTKTNQLILGRLIPENTPAYSQSIGLYYHYKVTSVKIIPGPGIREYKWVPAAQIGRYFTTSLGDPLLTWLTQLK